MGETQEIIIPPEKREEATGDLIGNKVADRITKSTRNKAQK